MTDRLRKVPMEAWIWVVALIGVLFIDPHGGEEHFSLCLFSQLGFSWCPGCGLGRSMALFLSGDLSGAFHMHWLGIPAFFLLLHRTIHLFRKSFKTKPI